jgi:hypothetical protein
VRHKFQPLGLDGTLMALRIQRGLLAMGWNFSDFRS